jgi:gag-polypeptide of LTR copia-type
MSLSNNTDEHSTTISTFSTDSIIHINAQVPAKLTDSNYLSWKNQILLIIEGNDLESFLFNNYPEPTITNTAGTIVVNPAYAHWKRQDKLLNAWIRSTLSDSILAQVMTSSTCQLLWQAIQTNFSTSSRARLQDLKNQLQNLSKDNLSCSDYLLKIRQLADELTFVGNSISDDDLVSAAVKG